MLKITLLSVKPKQNYPYQNHTSTTTQPQTKKMFELVSSRNSIIVKTVNDCSLVVGNHYKAYSLAQQKKWGKDVEVLSFIDDYATYLKEHTWIVDETPKVVRCFSHDLQKPFTCTPSFLIEMDAKEE